MTHGAIPLILNQTDVERGDRPTLLAGVELVYATADGQLFMPGRYSLMDAWTARYKRRYTVDISDHRSTITTPLSSTNGAFDFSGEVQLGWRVSDPVTVVRRNIRDGHAVAVEGLVTRIRQISMHYAIEDHRLAEKEINRVLAAQELVLDEGLTIFRATAKLDLDERTIEHVHQLAQLKSDVIVDQTRHLRDAGRAQRAHEISAAEQEHKLQLGRERQQAVQEAIANNINPLMIHLAENPQDALVVAQLIMSDRDSTQQRRHQIIQDLLSQGHIHEGDLDAYRAELLGGQPPAIGSASQPIIGGPSPASAPPPAGSGNDNVLSWDPI